MLLSVSIKAMFMLFPHQNSVQKICKSSKIHKDLNKGQLATYARFRNCRYIGRHGNFSCSLTNNKFEIEQETAKKRFELPHQYQDDNEGDYQLPSQWTSLDLLPENCLSNLIWQWKRPLSIRSVSANHFKVTKFYFVCQLLRKLIFHQLFCRKGWDGCSNAKTLSVILMCHQ